MQEIALIKERVAFQKWEMEVKCWHRKVNEYCNVDLIRPSFHPSFG